MLISVGREKVLNFLDWILIVNVNWGIMDFEKEIEVWVDLYVDKYL